MIWSLTSINDRVRSWKEYDIDVVLIAPSHAQNAGNTKGGPGGGPGFGQKEGVGKGDIVLVTMDIKYELSQLRRYSCKKRLLHSTLSNILGVSRSKFEIGYIEVTTEGCKIHIIHQVASMAGDRDISKLYEGKYELLGDALKTMYHISLEWGLFCTLSDDMQRQKSRSVNSYEDNHNHRADAIEMSCIVESGDGLDLQMEMALRMQKINFQTQNKK